MLLDGEPAEPGPMEQIAEWEIGPEKKPPGLPFAAEAKCGDFSRLS
jgi:hypothetical protein